MGLNLRIPAFAVPLMRRRGEALKTLGVGDALCWRSTPGACPAPYRTLPALLLKLGAVCLNPPSGRRFG